MNDLAQLAHDSLAQLFESGKVKEMIDKQVESTLQQVIKSSIETYSPFGKALAEHIKSLLPAEFKELELDNYNQFVMNMIQQKLGLLQNAEMRADIEKMLDEMFKAAPAEIKLSQFSESVREHFKDSNYSNNEHFTFRLEIDGQWTHIDIDEEPDKQKYACEYRVSARNGEVYSLRINGEDPKKTLFIGPHYNFERTLMQMFYGKTKLIIDCDEDDIDTSLVDWD